MKKNNRIKLTEGQLHRVIKESVKRILKEVNFHGEHFDGRNFHDWNTINTLRGYTFPDEVEEPNPLDFDNEDDYKKACLDYFNYLDSYARWNEKYNSSFRSAWDTLKKYRPDLMKNRQKMQKEVGDSDLKSRERADRILNRINSQKR